MNYCMNNAGAVIVGYNDTDDLKKCINSIIEQTMLVRCIIVIDNSDSDIACANQRLVDTYNEDTYRIIYIPLAVNSGSAGGYGIGMEIALKLNLDFIWLNDQDGIADKGCLQSLIDAYAEIKADGIYAPCIISTSGHYDLSYFRTRINAFGKQALVNRDGMSGYSKIDIAGTTGILITRGVIEQIGVYNSQVFFVGNEDVEYCLRAKRNGINAYLVNNANYYHPDLYVKNNMKTRRITNSKIPQKMRPLYLGVVATDIRKDTIWCKGASYINEVYCHPLARKINWFYSSIRNILMECTGRKIELKMTSNAYREGRKCSKNNDEIFRVSSHDINNASKYLGLYQNTEKTETNK